MRQFYIITILAITTLACQKVEDKEVETSFFEEGIKLEEPTTAMSKPVLIHTVFFWAKEGTTPDQLKDFEQGLIKLGTCPQIKDFFWGPPASTEKRDVVDNSYDYAINVHFASLEDQAAYQNEPIHKAFIEDHKDIWGKVIVYDNKMK